MSRRARLAGLAAALGATTLLAGCEYAEQWRQKQSEEAAFSREIAAVDRETWCGLYNPEVDVQYVGPPAQGAEAPVFYTFEPMGLPDFRALGYDAMISKRIWHPEDSTHEVLLLVAAESGTDHLTILQRAADRTPVKTDASARAFLECLVGP